LQAVQLRKLPERRFGVSGGEIAALIAAGAFLMFVVIIAIPIIRLRHTVDAATEAINSLNDRAGPILGNVNTTVENVNTALTEVHTSLEGVNLQLARIDTITHHAAQVSANVANLTTVVTSAAANPLAKAAAFAYGVRRASSRRRAASEESELRAQLKADRKERKRGVFS
jgi:uncharacterized protein YoxC